MFSGKDVRMSYETAKCRLFGTKMQIKNIRSIVNNLFFEIAPNYYYQVGGIKEYR